MTQCNETNPSNFTENQALPAPGRGVAMQFSAIVRELVAAGLSGEDLVQACERIEAADIAACAPVSSEEKRRARNQRYYDSHPRKTVTVLKRLNPDGPSLEVPVPPAPPPLPNPILEPPSPPKGAHGSSESQTVDNSAFANFWALYPNKVGKADARRKFDIARRSVTIETLMEGLRRYAAKTDDRPWCNPATWLHQARWEDQPAAPVAQLQRRSLYVSEEEIQTQKAKVWLQKFREDHAHDNAH
jgi:hypothetical protein